MDNFLFVAFNSGNKSKLLFGIIALPSGIFSLNIFKPLPIEISVHTSRDHTPPSQLVHACYDWVEAKIGRFAKS